jgi:hypothetical protein
LVLQIAETEKNKSYLAAGAGAAAGACAAPGAVAGAAGAFAAAAAGDVAGLGATGAACLAAGAGALSIKPDGLLDAVYVNVMEVSMKMIATAAVNFPRKVPAPPEPKTVWLEPPKAAPMFAPLPA